MSDPVFHYPMAVCHFRTISSQVIDLVEFLDHLSVSYSGFGQKSQALFVVMDDMQHGSHPTRTPIDVGFEIEPPRSRTEHLVWLSDVQSWLAETSNFDLLENQISLFRWWANIFLTVAASLLGMLVPMVVGEKGSTSKDFDVYFIGAFSLIFLAAFAHFASKVVTAGRALAKQRKSLWHRIQTAARDPRLDPNRIESEVELLLRESPLATRDLENLKQKIIELLSGRQVQSPAR